MKNLIIIMIFVLLILSCSETPTEPEIKYSGITETSSAGPEPIGNIDPDDWYYHPTSINEPVQFSVAPAYPNPANRYTTLHFTIPKVDSVKVWLHDPMRDKEVILINQHLHAGTYEMQIDLLCLIDTTENCENYSNLKEGIVRVFVDFNEEDIPLIHGDIQIIK